MLRVADYERFYIADQNFFETPERLSDDDTELEFRHRPLPAGWRRKSDRWWVRVSPDTGVSPSQGWLLHVSIVPDQVVDATRVVWDFCLSRKLAFDFVRSVVAARYLSGNRADREISGRLLTICVTDRLEQVLHDLAPLVEEFAGPYIAGTLRHHGGPVYVRYGSLDQQKHLVVNGERVPAIKRPDGGFVVEPHGALFSVPEWLELPEPLEADFRALRAKTGEEFPYQIAKALEQLPGGGTYFGTSKLTGLPVVLKEGRPLAGVSLRGEDSVSRIMREHDTLGKLDGLECVPRLIDYRVYGGHHFLAVEHIPGTPLSTRNLTEGGYPLATATGTEQKVSEYARRVEVIVSKVRRALDQIHARGFRLGALDPQNVIVKSDDEVCLTDLTSAVELEDTRPPETGDPQFSAPPGLDSTAAHSYLCERLRLWLLLPFPFHTPQKVRTLSAAAEHHFRLPAGTAASIVHRLSQHIDISKEDHAGALLATESPNWPLIRDSIVRGIHESSSPERWDRLFPCAPSDRRTIGGYGFTHGAAGVLYALHQVGSEVPSSYIAWLIAATRRDTEPAAGLFDGLHGVAFTLNALGQTDHALETLASCEPLEHDSPSLNLASGAAGMALNLMAFAAATNESSLRERAWQLIEKVIGRISAGPLPARQDEYPPYGLLHGGSGVALLFVRIYEESRDDRYLDFAETALNHDIARCSMPGYLFDGEYQQPYIHGGSYGLALVLSRFLKHRPDPAKTKLLADILKVCDPIVMVYPGLLRGRAGAIATLVDCGGEVDRRAIARQIRHMAWHAYLHNGNLTFPGMRGRRFSSDLASGAAGVLLALNSAFEGGRQVLPYLDLQKSNQLEGGVGHVGDS